MFLSARKLINSVRYQYHNDPLFRLRIDQSETVNLDSFILELILNPKLRRDYLIQQGMWKRKMEDMVRQAKKLMKEMNAEKVKNTK